MSPKSPEATEKKTMVDPCHQSDQKSIEIKMQLYLGQVRYVRAGPVSDLRLRLFVFQNKK